MKLNRKAALSLMVLMCLSACNREATGQVAAVVNDDEITLQEINAELAALQIPETADKKLVQQQALQRIIERRLLAQEASADGVATSQDYLIRERQLRDTLLVQLLGERMERSASPPDAADLDKYISDNPSMFTERKIYAIDRIQFPAPADINTLGPLKDDHSMAAVSSRLDRMGIEFRRSQGEIDAAAIGPDRLKQLLALPAGEPFVIPEGGVVTIGVITGERTAPLSSEEARTLALRTLQAQKINDAVRQRLEKARAKAEITYQPGFAPAKSGAQPKQAGGTN